MAVRESFLTVNDTLAAAPGPGHYSLEAGTGFGSDKGKGPLHSKVCLGGYYAGLHLGGRWG